MKKIIVAALLTILTSFGCAGRVQQDRQALSIQKEQKNTKNTNYQNISFADNSIELNFPRGWYENKKKNPYDLQYFSRRKDMNTGVIIYDLDDLSIDATPQNTLEWHIEQLKSHRENFTILEPEKTEQIGDKTLTTVVYSGGKDSSANYYKFTSIEFAESPTQFLITLQVSVPSKWNENKPILEEITHSAKMKLGSKPKPTLQEARKEFNTAIVNSGESYGSPDLPSGDEFELIHYQSPVGRLAAYVTSDPNDGKKHPAIVWITGGDTNTIGDVWTPRDRSNDQSASAFREAGIVMMFPSQRGGNDNPGQREGFYGEVDDILAATEHLAKLPYVDPDQIYLGGHSTGGTMVMLVGAYSDRYRGIFSLGPVASVKQYGGDFVYFDIDDNNKREWKLRSPIHWLHSIKNPMFVFEGEYGNIDSIQFMAERNHNPNIKFFELSGYDHFNAIAPVTEILAEQIVEGQVNVTQQTLEELR